MSNPATTVAIASAVPFDLFFAIKEAQVQHGLRTGDFSRYHKYTTTRIATLRKQLNISNSTSHQKKKAFTNKPVTPDLLLQSTGVMDQIKQAKKNASEESASVPTNPNELDANIVAAAAFSALTNVNNTSGNGKAAQGGGGGRYLELLMLYAERCWAEYENIMAKRANAGNEYKSDSKSTSGVPPVTVARKKLNKAVKWTSKLVEVAKEVSKLAEESFSSDGTSKIYSKYQKDLARLGVQYVIDCTEGYHLEMQARCEACHGNSAEAKEAYTNAREKITAATETLGQMTELSVAQASSKGDEGARVHTAVLSQVEPSHQIAAAKLAELDDRILYTMQQLGEPLTDFHAASVGKLKLLASTSTVSSSNASQPKASYLTDRSTVKWLKNSCKKLNEACSKKGEDPIADDEIVVYSLKVKEALREAAVSNPASALQSVMKNLQQEEESKDGKGKQQRPLINVGTQMKILDQFDRCAGALNDAITHARQEQRSAQGEIRKKQGQLLLLFLQFHVGRTSADRTLFLIEVYMRRYLHMKQLILKKKKSGGKIPPVSPLELVRLYGMAIETLEELLHIPGVEGGEYLSGGESRGAGDLIEEQIEECKAAKLFMAAESWAATGNFPAAMNPMKEAQAAMSKCNSSFDPNLSSTDCPFESLTVSHVAGSPFLFSSCSIGPKLADIIGYSAVSLAVETNLISYRASGKKKTEESSNKKLAAAAATAKQQYLSENLEAFSSAVTTAGQTKQGIEAKIVPFPPKYTPVACKPVFVDLASTFVTFPTPPKGSAAKVKGKTGEGGATEEGEKPSGWLGGWGWKK